MNLEEQLAEDIKQLIDARIRCLTFDQDSEHFYSSLSEEKDLAATIKKILNL